MYQKEFILTKYGYKKNSVSVKISQALTICMEYDKTRRQRFAIRKSNFDKAFYDKVG